MATLLKLKDADAAGAHPVEAAAMSPDRIAGLPRREVERLLLFAGNREVPLGELFSVEGDGTEEITVVGDLSRFSLVGAGMSRGRLVVRGGVGARAGSGMSGGVLSIEGDAGDYAGEGMSGGLLRVRGRAGDHLAAPPAGRPHGLNRGTILVHGDAGEMAAFRMRRGTIVIGGAAGPAAGCAMRAGSLFVFRRLGPGAGALMRRGTIVAFDPGEPLPVFLDAGRSRQPFLNLYYDRMEAAGIAPPAGARGAFYRRLVGDISGAGMGEILLPEAAA
jgi:formylmethanofuran dehydrogenase subunit C